MGGWGGGGRGNFSCFSPNLSSFHRRCFPPYYASCNKIAVELIRDAKFRFGLWVVGGEREKWRCLARERL